MDEVCNKLEGEDLNRTTADVEVIDFAKRCGSPVFKCINPTKPMRGNNLDSSDYDIPSYQVNQSVKSRTSSKYGSETNESVLPISPIFSPIPYPSTQFQPPSIHSLGTVSKILDKTSRNNVKTFSQSNKEPAKFCGLFESLGMNDKDISWVSSMASPPPKQVPGSEFNTIEKATFFPEEKFQNIQPRALFSPNLDEDFDCHPISFCSESEDDNEAYKSNIRLSDVCATLKQLEVKSLDQVSELSAENIIQDPLISPVIKTRKKKPESVKKKKKATLVVSPDKEQNYEFSLRENKNLKCEKTKPDGTNFIEDDSFQSMSFSYIDELCKTLVTEGSNSSAVSRSIEIDCEKTLSNASTISPKCNVPKIFYDSKTTTVVHEVPLISSLHSYAKALEEGDTGISVSSKIDKSYADRGIVRFDVLSKDPVKVDATKRLHSEVTEENDSCSEKKFKKVDDENKGWEKMKEYLSESQLNVSDGEIFRTVENLEKTLASQDSKDLGRLSGFLAEAEGSDFQNECASATSKENPEGTKEEAKKMAVEYNEDDDVKGTSQDLQTVPFMGFKNALGWKMSVSTKALEKAKEILKDCIEEKSGCEGLLDESDKLIQLLGGGRRSQKEWTGSVMLEKANAFTLEQKSCKETSAESSALVTGVCTNDLNEKLGEGFVGGFINGYGKQIQVTSEAFEKAKAFMSDCGESSKVNIIEAVSEGFSTGSGKKILVSGKALEKAKVLMMECNESWKKEVEEGGRISEAFSTGAGRKVEVSTKALEKAKTFLGDCDGNVIERSEKASASRMKGFFTSSGKQVQVSAKALEKAKALMKECDESVSEKPEKVKTSSFKDEKLQRIPVSYRALENAKNLWGDCEENPKNKSTTSKGFLTGLGKPISVSAEALEKAKAPNSNSKREMTGSSNDRHVVMAEDETKQAFNSCKRVMSETEVSDGKGEKSQASLEVQGSTVFGFSTASGDRINISVKAIEKAKSLLCDSRESAMEMSSETDSKAVLCGKPSLKDLLAPEESERVLLNEEAVKGDLVKGEDSGEAGSFAENAKTSVKSGLENSKSGDVSGAENVDDSDEIIPGWLHVYSTSPSVASDRTELSPLVAHEDGKSSRPAREYVVKSPVLGSGDRFHGKRKKRKLLFKQENKFEQKTQTGFVVPYKDSGRKAGAKRTSGLAMDFSVPFKKVKFVEVKSVELDVKGERARRREEQEKAIREKHSVKPCRGLHFSKKCSEKQMKWMEAVGGSSPGMHSDEALKSLGVHEDVLRVTVANALSFTFNGQDFFGPNCEKNIQGIPAGDGCLLILNDDNKVGVEECKRAFLASSSVQPSLVPDGWVQNHYKWIVWKLAHYERSFPRYFAGRCLTPGNVMLQLKYRYDREIDRSERSALKKILERDDTAAKRLVLCVCGIEKIGGSETSRYELSLTDGWYSCPARPDPAMTKILDEGKLRIGTKLLTQGAVLVNCEQGVSPLEISGDIHLKISTNSTRRVKWDTKLGFQKNPQNFPISLSSILAQGGPISRIDVIIVRVYPVLYMEKTSDGHHVTRNRRSEEKADAEYRRIQEQKMETICNEVRMEMKKSVGFGKKLNINCATNIDQTEEMCELMERSLDPSVSQDQMTAEQRKYIENLQLNQSDRFSRELSEKVGKRLEKENLLKRNVSEFFRAKIVDVRKPDYNNPAVLSVWHPNEDLVALLSEGKVVSLMNVTINNSSRLCKPLQINTTRQTQYIPISRSVKYPARKLAQLKEVSSKICPAFEEVDLVGVVVLVQNMSHGSRESQIVYLTDSGMNFVGIVFWGSCKSYGWENVLRIRSIVACSNLKWKRNQAAQDVPSLFVNENSVFTENPKLSYLKEEVGRLKQNIPQDMTTFLSKCEEELMARLEEAKWRVNSSKNLSANEFTPRGTHPPEGQANCFESKPTASSTPIKPFTAKTAPDEPEPSPIQKRIEKLQAYGEPPSLIPLIVRNNAKKRFRKKSSGISQ